MYRGAVPITEHQPADVLEPLRGTGWRGYPNPTNALRSGRFACPALRAIVGLGVCETAPRFTLYPFLLARRRHTGTCGFLPTVQQQLNQAQYAINERPRKKLDFSTPKVEFFKNIL